MKTFKLSNYSKGFIDNASECLHNYENIFRSYGFENGINHTTIKKMYKNSIYIYCSFSCRLPDKVFSKPIKINVDISVGDFVFYDYQNESFRRACKNADIIIYDRRNRLVGGYFISKNILIGTDWTHLEFKEKEITKILEAIKPYLNKVENKEENELYIKSKISLGADIEVEQVIEEKIVSAYGNFSTINTEYGEIGIDGSGDQIEYRPVYAYSHNELVKNIQHLIAKTKCNISVSGRAYPLGFHIHFGIENEEEKELLKINKNTIAKIFARYNKELFSELTIQKVRRDYNYGRDNDIREQEWGIEYRGIPSIILADKKLTELILKLYYSVVVDFLKNGKITLTEDVNDFLKYITYDEYLYIKESLVKADSEDLLIVNDVWIEGYEYDVSVIIFKNEYSEITKFAKKYFNTVLENKEKKKINRIRIVSLHKDRGLVISGFTSELAPTIDVEHLSRKYTYGIPYEFKKRIINGDYALLITLLENIVEQIKQTEEVSA